MKPSSSFPTLRRLPWKGALLLLAAAGLMVCLAPMVWDAAQRQPYVRDKILEYHAGQGDAESLFQLARSHERGHAGGPRDYKKAAEYYRRAADEGSVKALNNLAILYLNGQGVEQNPHKAAALYAEAGEQGLVLAQNNLGDLLLNEKHLPADPVRARYWHEKAAAQGHSGSIAVLGYLYDKGMGVAPDYTRARDYYAQAAEAGNDAALYNICQLAYLGRPNLPADPALAFKWCQQGADSGHENAPAMANMVALYYYNGIGAPRDYYQAGIYFARAANTITIARRTIDHALSYCQSVPDDDNPLAQAMRDGQCLLAAGAGEERSYERAAAIFTRGNALLSLAPDAERAQQLRRALTMDGADFTIVTP